MKKLSILNIAPFLILIVIVIILFWKSFLFGYLPIPSDIIVNRYLPWMSRCFLSEEAKNPLLSDPITQFYPNSTYSTEVLRKGKISLWNPFIFCGKPEFIVPFIPPFNIFQYLMPPFVSYGLTIILQVFLSGLFMYLFLRYGINTGKFASLIGAIVFMLNGVFAVWLEFGATVGAGLWFPLIFLFIEKTIAKKSFFYGSLGAIFLGLQCFSGHLQFFSYLLLACFFYSSFRILCLYKEFRSIKKLFKPAILVLLVFIFGILLTCVYLVPVFSRAETGFRQKVRFEELNSLPVANLVTFVIPDFYGTPAPPHSYRTIRSWFYQTGLIKRHPVKVGGENYNEYCGYIGVLPLILALLAGLLRKDRDSRFFFGFWIVSLLLALGTFLYLPLYWFAPGFNKIGISRIIFLFCFSGSILAGMGAEEVGSRKWEVGSGKRIVRVVVWVLGIATIGWLIFLLLPKFNSPLTTHCSSLLAWHFSLKNPSMTIPVLLILSSIIILSLKTQNLIKGAILVVISFDLLYFSMKYNPMTPKEWLFPETPSLNFLTDKLDREPPFRIVAFDRILPPNTNIVYRLQSVEGYESLHSARYHDFMKELVSPDVYHNWIDIISRANRKFLQLLNVKYVLADRELKGEDLELVYDDEIRIYEDLKAFPRAWVVTEAKVLKARGAIFAELESPNFDPKKTVILEEEPKTHHPSPITHHPSPITEIVSYQPEKVVIEADLSQAGFLVLSDSYYPGWKVFVDGKEGRVLRANYIMRAVELGPGRHRVEFIYDPPSFKIGLIISLATLSLIISLIIILAGYAVFKKPHDT